MTFKILTLNNISATGLERLPQDRYEVGDSMESPDAILLRSFKMHDMEIPQSLKAVARAGAGTNNIPVDKLTRLGIPVFNSPGANANAVKELVISGLLLACRNLPQAWDYTRQLEGDDAALAKLVEEGKKKFAGFELPGRTIGVVGLGAIGRMVANTCVALGMKAIGFDPGLTVEGAWQLSAEVRRAESVEEMLPQVDFITFHVPLIDATRHMLNASNIGSLKQGATVLNMARGGVVDDEAICAALDRGELHAYVSDFPTNRTKACSRVIALPHLGASTAEAEDNCAVMVADQLRDFLENGNITNSVNFPAVNMRRGSEHRLVIANLNVPNMVGQISTAMAAGKLNIHDMINQSRGEIAYTVVDTDSAVPESVVENVRGIQGVMMARVL
ncbi:MAG: phosphoglycerate dehydrogenase [Planctomycetales bacterium]|nr:phosphoglycerate dehydrogenase [Planctomycetales bacterium]